MSGNNASPEPGARDNSREGKGPGRDGRGTGKRTGIGTGKGIGAAVGAAAIALAAAWFGLDGGDGGADGGAGETGTANGNDAAGETGTANDNAGARADETTGRAPAERTVSNQDDISALSDTCPVDMLPVQADDVIDRILTNQDHIYTAHDGKHFGNYEGRLPRERGNYYREYTVDTPGLNHRGERRIVVGGGTEDDPDVWYYTDDHYETFCVIPDAED